MIVRDAGVSGGRHLARERRGNANIGGPSSGQNDETEGPGEVSRHASDSHAALRVTPLAPDIESGAPHLEPEAPVFTRSAQRPSEDQPIRTWCVTRPGGSLRELVGFDLAVIAATPRECLTAAPWVSELVANHVLVLVLTAPLAWQRRPRRWVEWTRQLMDVGMTGVYVDAPGRAWRGAPELLSALELLSGSVPAARLAVSSALPADVQALSDFVGPAEVLADLVSS